MQAYLGLSWNIAGASAPTSACSVKGIKHLNGTTQGTRSCVTASVQSITHNQWPANFFRKDHILNTLEFVGHTGSPEILKSTLGDGNSLGQYINKSVPVRLYLLKQSVGLLPSPVMWLWGDMSFTVTVEPPFTNLIILAIIVS